MEIRISEIGQIVAGDEIGRYVKIVNDSENTGGFLILTSSKLDMSDGYDNWVEDKNALTRYFEEAKWIVDWA